MIPVVKRFSPAKSIGNVIFKKWNDLRKICTAFYVDDIRRFLLLSRLPNNRTAILLNRTILHSMFQADGTAEECNHKSTCMPT
jgi:hypothetical protein